MFSFMRSLNRPVPSGIGMPMMMHCKKTKTKEPRKQDNTPPAKRDRGKASCYMSQTETPGDKFFFIVTLTRSEHQVPLVT